MSEPKEDYSGCVTVFFNGEEEMSIWKRPGSDYVLDHRFSPRIHAWTYQPMFQALAKEIHRLSSLVGSNRRKGIDLRRQLRATGLEPCNEDDKGIE